jgi:hypothetical protein
MEPHPPSIILKDQVSIKLTSSLDSNPKQDVESMEAYQKHYKNAIK